MNVESHDLQPQNVPCHDDVTKWKHFPRYWPFVRGIHRSRWIPHTKASDARNFDVFFDLRLNKRLSKQPGGWWFETLSWSLWRHCNAVASLDEANSVDSNSDKISQNMIIDRWLLHSQRKFESCHGNFKFWLGWYSWNHNTNNMIFVKWNNSWQQLVKRFPIANACPSVSISHKGTKRVDFLMKPQSARHRTRFLLFDPQHVTCCALELHAFSISFSKTEIPSNAYE